VDAALGFFLVLVFMTLFVLLCGFTYKCRAQVAKWLNYPYYAEGDRELQLKRKIENAQAELKWVQENKSSR